MNNNKSDFNDLIMEEIGLEIDDNGVVIDQDTEEPIKVSGNKTLKLREGDFIRLTKHDAEFDPLNNPYQMNHLFVHYAEKLQAEDPENGYIKTFYNVPSKTNPEMGQMEAVMGENTVITSQEYYNDSVKYADLICKMNDESKDLSSFDSKLEKKPRKKTVRK